MKSKMSERGRSALAMAHNVTKVHGSVAQYVLWSPGSIPKETPTEMVFLVATKRRRNITRARSIRRWPRP